MIVVLAAVALRAYVQGFGLVEESGSTGWRYVDKERLRVFFQQMAYYLISTNAWNLMVTSSTREAKFYFITSACQGPR